MDSLSFALLSALWLGILTSISPCPLGTNIAAISFIAKRMANARLTVLAGVSYTFGRMLAYFMLSVLILKGVESIPALSEFLTKHINSLLGPLLIVTGVFLLQLLPITLGGISLSNKWQKKLVANGLIGAAILGFIFALSFCPISAALFFGSLIPLAMSHQSVVILPMAYGIGTALPVLIFAFIIAYFSGKLGTAFNALGKIEYFARTITGVIFILLGVYYTLRYVFEVI